MEIREADLDDVSEIVPLINQLGYEVTSELIQTKLTNFSTTPIDAVLVAVHQGLIIGVISCHLTSLFHQAGLSGRITSLVIDKNHQGLGAGRALVQAAEEFFINSGCIKSEVTSGDHRLEAHEFYQSCGYKLDERRLLKMYS
ncbi:MAG: GNAT family N-acetyltransferase [Cyanobacteria bacterium P01_F01_bin.116]